MLRRYETLTAFCSAQTTILNTIRKEVKIHRKYRLLQTNASGKKRLILHMFIVVFVAKRGGIWIYPKAKTMDGRLKHGRNKRCGN